jgi:hypothetical protein
LKELPVIAFLGINIIYIRLGCQKGESEMLIIYAGKEKTNKNPSFSFENEENELE